MAVSKEEEQRLKDEAAGYYLGLWNLLVQGGAPNNLMIDAAVNNLLAVLDHYMPTEGKMQLLEKVLQVLKEEHAASTERMQ